MKNSAFFAATLAAVAASATGIDDADKVNCARPNANYCIGGDIILRCDENSIGTKGRCSANVSGYPPFGGTAECFESSEEAGDAACQKNCVVYAEPSFTLPADRCTPSYIPTPVRRAVTNAESDMMSIPEGTNLVTADDPATDSVDFATVTGTMSIPEGSLAIPDDPVTVTGDTMSIPEGTLSIPEGTLPVPTSASTSTSHAATTGSLTEQTRTPTATMPSGRPSTRPTGTAATESQMVTRTTAATTAATAVTTTAKTALAHANRVTGLLLAAGIVAVYLL
ncbi:hypothetical protein DCS_01539 [Drechmeria coniospora]|uniref:Uncharacterized protein n=1 Tax=Drechmeria coniospora TaxID=98403 RepID=A0A151GTR6_DRECN|nr:hypothetical protein DCS_01539 [Drechmeria coniospora]KYK60402.1 hypothetical protein DCS_01539 [Drechmeria coniospora]ODA80343.1 hypothetical protein RJ55_03301 [Drechmeria coniospora]